MKNVDGFCSGAVVNQNFYCPLIITYLAPAIYHSSDNSLLLCYDTQQILTKSTIPMHQQTLYISIPFLRFFAWDG